MEGSVLYRVVREHFETFRAEIASLLERGRLIRFATSALRWENVPHHGA
jgi:hypothetical protein